MLPLAVGLMPLETRHDVILHLATKAEALGYEAFFLSETWSYDMTVLMTEIALHTSRLKIGTAVLSVWGRTAATIAMAAATINIISDGRFTLGLGASSPPLTEGFHDKPFDKPLTKLRQTVTQVRALLTGNRIPLQNSSENRPLKLNLPPQPDIPICLGASATKSIHLAGELADGWFPFLVPKDNLAELIDTFVSGTKLSQKPENRRLICPAISVMVDENEAQARAAMAWFIAFYLTMMGPIYPQSLARLGYEAEVRAVQEANKGRKPALVPDEAEILLKQLTIYGRPDSVKEQLAPWYDNGVTMPALLLNPGLTIEQYDRILESFV